MQNALYKNEKVKRQFLGFLRESEGFAESSINSFEQSIFLWEDFTKSGDFSGFGKVKAIGFKKFLVDKKLGASYRYHTLRKLKKFFKWLSNQPGYKSKINLNYVAFLNLNKQESRIARQGVRKNIPTLEEIKKVIRSIQVKNEVDQRDRALISFVLAFGVRITALISLPLGSFDEKELVLEQDPKLGVRTKFSKRITSTAFPIKYKEPLKHVLEWVRYLKEEKEFGSDDPLFPATKLENGEENISYQNTGTVKPCFWKDSSSARRVFEKRFKEAGVTYYHPHSLRHLLVKELTRVRLTEEEKKAVSQNFGHEDVGTTFGSYGYGVIAEDKQVELVKNINPEDRETEPGRLVNQLEGLIRQIKEK